MSTVLYDEALLNKLKSWTKTTKLNILGVNETNRLFEILGDTTDDSPITLPMITLSRNRGLTIINAGTTKRPLSYNGAKFDHKIYNKGEDTAYSTTSTIQGIPVSLSYQIDVYTRYAEEADILIRNLIFNIINYPSFYITIPHSNDSQHLGRITLNDVVEDNSDIPERFVSGNFVRLSLVVTVDDAYLWDTRELHDVAIDLILDDSNEPWEWNKEHTKVEKPDLSKRDHMSIPDPKSLT